MTSGKLSNQASSVKGRVENRQIDGDGDGDGDGDYNDDDDDSDDDDQSGYQQYNYQKDSN